MVDDARITVTPVVVRSTDVDADGHVNNAVYYEYCEQGRLDHLARLGVIPLHRRDRPYANVFTIVETCCRYLAPAYHRDVLDVQAWTRKVGRSSFVLGYRILRRDDGQVVAEGESVQVWLGPDGRATPLPERTRAALERSCIPVDGA